MRLKLLDADELERRRMRGLQNDRRGHVMFERILPPRHANTPFVARFESRKSPFRMGSDQVVAIQDGKIEEFAGYLYTNSVQSSVFRSGAAIAVAKKPG